MPGTRAPEAFIIDGVRTPIGSYGGSLAGVRADDLAAFTIRSLLARYPTLDPSRIEDVILGCANQAGEDNRNVARMALLLAGLPVTVPGVTVNRLCASGMSAVTNAAFAICGGAADLLLAGGVEHMTRAPYVMAKPSVAFSRVPEMFDTTLGWRFVNPVMMELHGIDSMGETAENVATLHRITRDEQDSFALSSQEKAAKARDVGRLAREIAPIEVRSGKNATSSFTHDEFIRSDTTLSALRALKPAFKKEGGSVTAGNSSGLNDGSAALLLASEKAIKEHSLTPRAKLVATSVIGVPPRIMGMGPVEASKSVLRRAGLKLADMNVIELNEAFAAQSVACLKELGLSPTDERVNPNGGAIALGHPLGMSGARLILTAMTELHERKARYALCTMCVGVGQGIATIIERV